MKLSLEELKVESYSTQVCENELEMIKGGSGWACFWATVDAVGVTMAVGMEVWAWINCSNPPASSGGSTILRVITSDGDTLNFSTNLDPDTLSYSRTTPNGTTTTLNVGW